MIQVKNLRKVFSVPQKESGFKGSLRALIHRQMVQKVALGGVDLQVAPGEILGLIGANGAGKTTLVKCLSGIICPTSGSISVMGFDPWKRDNRLRRQLALVMGQKAQLWWDLPAGDSLLLLKEIYNIEDVAFRKNLAFLANHLDVTKQLNTPLRRLSLGERMKMELIAALIHQPKVIYLDEPTIGLDITAQRAIRTFLLEYRREFQPIMILTSHYMEDIASLCERIAILKEGQKVYDGSLKNIQQLYGQEKVFTAHLTAPATDLQPWLAQMNSKESVVKLVNQEDQALTIKVKRQAVAQVTTKILEHFPVHDFSVQEEDIADVIEKIMRQGHDPKAATVWS